MRHDISNNAAAIRFRECCGSHAWRGADKVRELRQYTEYAFVTESLSKEALTEIGIQNCDTAIICIGERIDTSILTTLNVISLGVPHVIAKAISQDQGAVLAKLGAEVVYPERDMALRLGKRLVSNNFLDFIFLDDQVEIQQVPVGDRMVDVSVQDFNIRRKYNPGLTNISSSYNFCSQKNIRRTK